MSRIDNEGSATIKGLEVTLERHPPEDLGFSVSANYMLTYTDGTPFDFQIIPAFLADLSGGPVNSDQRHRLIAVLGYRLGRNDGPALGTIHPLQNTTLHISAMVGSGFPYTSFDVVTDVINPRTPSPEALDFNGSRTPGTSRIDLRLERIFVLAQPAGSPPSLGVFFWVQNLLDTENVFGVWPYPGLPDDDGWLGTVSGQEFLQNSEPATEALYRHRTRIPEHYGLPRLMRLGVRLEL